MRWAAMLLLCGCSGPTRIVADVSLAVGARAPAALFLSVFDARGAIAGADGTIVQVPIAKPSLPGRLIVQVPPRDATLRLVLQGVVLQASSPSYAAASVDVRKGQDASLKLELSESLTDADDDAIPDIVDNCPIVDNLDQANADGDESGDACANVVPDGGADAGDAGTSPDASPDGGPPQFVCPSNAIFCDSFETPGLVAGYSMVTTRGRTENVDGDAVYGTRSLSFLSDAVLTDPGGGPRAQVELTRDIVPPTDVYYRVYMKLVDPIADANKARIMAWLPSANLNEGYSLWLYGDGIIEYFDVYKNIHAFSDPGVFHSGWVCVEWWMKFAASGSATVYIDGQPVISRQNNTVSPGQLDFFVLGKAFFGGETLPIAQNRLLVDGLVVAPSRVGCN